MSAKAEMERGYDKISVCQRTCQTCGMLLDDAGGANLEWRRCDSGVAA